MAERASEKWKKTAWTFFVLVVIFQAGLQFYKRRTDENQMRVLEEKLNHIEATGEQTLSIIGNNTPIQVTTPIKPTAPIRPLSKASLQLTRVFLPNQTMNPGSPIIMNMYLTNQGSEPAGDVHRFFAVALSHVQDSKRSDIEMHSRFLKAAAEDRKKWKPISQAKGTTLGIHEALWNTVGLPAISQEQYQGILDGTQRIYVYSWATWENAKSNLDICMWMQTPPTATITDMILLLCGTTVQDTKLLHLQV